MQVDNLAQLHICNTTTDAGCGMVRDDARHGLSTFTRRFGLFVQWIFLPITQGVTMANVQYATAFGF